MKALLVLVLLSTLSTANASIDLACSAVGLDESTTITMIQQNKTFEVIKTTKVGNSKRVETETLYIQGNPTKNKIGDTVYTGIAEKQIQVDTFISNRFTLLIPNILENNTTLIYENKAGVELERIEFKCLRSDNR